MLLVTWDLRLCFSNDRDWPSSSLYSHWLLAALARAISTCLRICWPACCCSWLCSTELVIEQWYIDIHHLFLVFEELVIRNVHALSLPVIQSLFSYNHFDLGSNILIVFPFVIRNHWLDNCLYNPYFWQPQWVRDGNSMLRVFVGIHLVEVAEGMLLAFYLLMQDY